jgi:hypothetical protein
MTSLTEGLYTYLLIIIDTMTESQSGSELTSESCLTVRTIAPHCPQRQGETQSVWKQKNARETWYVSATSSQTRWVHHPRHRQTTCIRRHSLVFEVYETSFGPTDLTSHLNVALKCGCVLSRISTMRDEVIGYKSPLLTVNSHVPFPVGSKNLDLSVHTHLCSLLKKRNPMEVIDDCFVLFGTIRSLLWQHF